MVELILGVKGRKIAATLGFVGTLSYLIQTPEHASANEKHRLYLSPCARDLFDRHGPNTSTTLTLAIALMDRHGLIPKAFPVFHPSGKLDAPLVHTTASIFANQSIP